MNPDAPTPPAADADPDSTPEARLLAAASALTEAALGVIEHIRGAQIFRGEVAAYAAAPKTARHPLEDELNHLADAIVNIHLAIGEPYSTSRLFGAAERWQHAED